MASLEFLEQRRLLSLTPLGPPTDLPFAGQGQSFDVAVAGNGQYIVLAVPRNGTDSLIATRYSATGEQLGTPITLASEVRGAIGSVAMDADGDAVVSWTAYGMDSDFSYVTRISKTGVVSAPVPIPAPALVSMDDAGDFFLGWTDNSSTSQAQDVKIQAFDAAGVARAPAFTVRSTTGFSSIGITGLGARPDGSGAVFTSGSSGESAPNSESFGRVSTTALIGQLSAISSGANQSVGDVVVHADGSFDIAFESYSTLFANGDPVHTESAVARYDAAGAAKGSVIVLSPASEEEGDLSLTHVPGAPVHIDDMPDGGFIAVYTRTTHDTRPILVQRFDAAGVADSDGPVQVGTHTIGTEQNLFFRPPVIGVDNNGTATVVFAGDVTADPIHLSRVTTAELAYVQDGILYAFGTAGADSIAVELSGSNLVVTRGTGSATFAAADVKVLLIDGFDGNDTITNNTPLKATLRGGAGSDTLFGGTGADRIHGGIGNDSLWGGGGSDTIFGEDGVDSCYGNGGNDRIEGGAQHDHIRGNGGRDKLYGNGGNDQIFGGASGDFIYGQAGADLLWGEGGNDRLYGDDGAADTLHGGAGDDVFITLDSVVDQLFGDGGHDDATGDDADVLTSIESIF